MHICLLIETHAHMYALTHTQIIHAHAQEGTGLLFATDTQMPHLKIQRTQMWIGSVQENTAEQYLKIKLYCWIQFDPETCFLLHHSNSSKFLKKYRFHLLGRWRKARRGNANVKTTNTWNCSINTGHTDELSGHSGWKDLWKNVKYSIEKKQTALHHSFSLHPALRHIFPPQMLIRFNKIPPWRPTVKSNLLMLVFRPVLG